MIGRALSHLKILLIASHLGPTALVVTITFLISLMKFPLLGAAEISLAIFFGQLVVGWSNEVIDFPLDKEARRVKKPLVAGDIQVGDLARLIPIALLAAVALSLFSPFGPKGTLIHLLGILSATAYNIRLKATVFSPLPYLVSFGGLPWAIFLAARENPPIWLYLGLALFAVAFHFLNVIKDIQWDADQGILGLPQRIGKRGSIVIAAILSLSGVILLIIF
ncbi:MAG: hypothetical protein EB054_00015 [Actinobacteria bacterium]|nr:hypothetical protein [Actinomycetota bacterium]